MNEPASHAPIPTPASSPAAAGVDPARAGPSGLPAAVAAYTMWGFLPLYLILVHAVPPFEFVAWRIIWTLPVCVVILAVRRQFPKVRAVLADRRTLLWLCGSSALIGVNWFTYVWAIQTEHVFAASLGYYINPLINVLMGVALLGERMSRPRWVAVGIATFGVAILAAGAISTLWVGLTLSLTFASYGLIRKRVSVAALPGLTIESLLLLPVALIVAIWFALAPPGSAMVQSLALAASIALGGVVTAVPLLLFAIAARRMDYSQLGMIQFVAPTIVFLLGLFVFGEPLLPVQAFSFALIWAALAIFIWDLLWARRVRPTSI